MTLLLDWWTLPGPTEFLDSAASCLRKGSSLVLAVPAAAGLDLPSRLADRIQREGVLDCVIVPHVNEEVPPREAVARSLGLGGLDTRIPDATELARCPEAAERVLLVRFPEREAWPLWRSFVSDYQHATREIDPCERGLICLVLAGASPDELPPGDICLDIRTWEGVTGRLDQLLLCRELARDRTSSNPVLTEVCHSMIAELAGFDLHLGLDLVQEEDEVLEDPLPWLAEVGRQRGWEPLLDEESPQALWAAGAADNAGGSWTLHSSLLALREDRRALLRRMWRGQVGVLLPWVEEQRVRILDRFPRLFESLSEERRLAKEVGEIKHHLASRRYLVTGEVWSLVSTLQWIRNELAHLRPIPLEYFRRQEVVQIERLLGP